MNKALQTVVAAGLMLCVVTTAARADIKLKFKTTQNARDGESIVHFKGSHQHNNFCFRRDRLRVAPLALRQTMKLSSISLDRKASA